jgi:mannitol-1-phosphate/altronate dehydrogenase
VNDENAAFYSSCWDSGERARAVSTILANQDIWQTDLNGLDGFAAEVNHWLQQLEEKGAKAVLEQVNNQKTILVNEK